MTITRDQIDGRAYALAIDRFGRSPSELSRTMRRILTQEARRQLEAERHPAERGAGEAP